MLKMSPIIAEGNGWSRNWTMIQISGYKNWTTSALCRVDNILSGNIHFQHSEWKPGVPVPSGYQVGISSALSLNATKTVKESTTQRHLTLFQDASIQEKSHFVLCYWIRQWLNETLSYIDLSAVFCSALYSLDVNVLQYCPLLLNLHSVSEFLLPICVQKIISMEIIVLCAINSARHRKCSVRGVKSPHSLVPRSLEFLTQATRE